MNRRQLIQLSLLAALAPGNQVFAAGKGAESAKKGLGLTVKNPDWSQKLHELRCKWFYCWGAKIPSGVPADLSFVPMIWSYRGNRDAVLQAGKAAKGAGIKELLGFNEPDGKSQGNMTVEKALDAWPVLQETGLRLGSPGCVHPDNAWMKEFMEGAKKRDLRVDFVCMHSYGGADPTTLIKQLEAVHKLYRKPICITEFAVGDWQAKSVEGNRFKPNQVVSFMEKILPWLEKTDFIERYAWFPAKPDSKSLGNSALFTKEGQLTRLGECYRDR
jgi:hypothetical protein